MKLVILFWMTSVLSPFIGHGKEATLSYTTVVGEFDAKGALIEQTAMTATTGKHYGAQISITGLKGNHNVSIEVVPPTATSGKTLGSARVSRFTASALIDFNGKLHTHGTGRCTLLEGQPTGDYEFRFYLDGELLAQRTFGIR